MTRWEGDFWLLTPEEAQQLPDGVEFESINGDITQDRQSILGRGIRFGHLAWGVRDPFNHEQRNFFLTFILKS